MYRVSVLAAVAVLLATSTSSTSARMIVDWASLPFLVYEDIVLAGGVGNGSLADVEVLEGGYLPELPTEVSENSLTALERVLYSCGGYDFEPTSKCNTLDLSDSYRMWSNTVDLPTPMHHHTATEMGSHIWFIYENNLYDLDTHSGLFEVTSTPFDVSNGHCAVSSYGFTYVIGVGRSKNEVYMNTKEYDGSRWERIVRLKGETKYASCLLYEDKIYITGGEESATQVEIVNLYSRTVDATSRLEAGRQKHGAFVLDGQPAVAGGWNDDNSLILDSIETHDLETNKWTLIGRTLDEAKFDFGYTQIKLE